jgi:NAD(P)-dependent dehydrogenase (short-subunit alcohol dehydrogenase family)
VILADINAHGLQEAEMRLQTELPDASGTVQSVLTDVRHEEEVRVLMARALAVSGRIDLVVTCAGIGCGGPIDTFAASEMQRMLDINVMGTFHCIQQALPAMRQQGSGHFICLSSIAGKLGNPFLAGYCASKWAVRGFTSAVRAELEGSGIGITTVYPSWVETPLIHQQGDPMFASIEALLTPEGVAEAMLQAALEDQRDLTLVPNPEIRRALEIYTENPEKAERKMGQAMRQVSNRAQP